MNCLALVVERIHSDFRIPSPCMRCRVILSFKDTVGQTRTIRNFHIGRNLNP